MIAGIFHQGSGLGNQLHRYVMTRVLAADKGYEWGMIYQPDGSGKQEGFKGDFFLEQPKLISEAPPVVWYEKKVIENGIDIRGYDPEINFVRDNTTIDGEFQDIRYFKHRLPEIDQWLKVEELEMPDNVCVIGFRGGEYAMFPDLFLTKEYWDEAILLIRMTYPDTVFQVHTDDVILAKQFFPDYECIHEIGLNWRSMRYAKRAIIANSSFFIFPRLLRHIEGMDALTIAPRYWARHNTKTWALPQNYYEYFTYL